MKLRVEKANAFVIDPNKKYLVMVTIDEGHWSEQQKADLVNSLEGRNMRVVFVPKGTKYKIVEEANG